MYVLNTEYRRNFSSMSQSSDELKFQVMVIAKNKRSTERFPVLLQCGLLQRRRFFYQNVQPISGSSSLKFFE